jgi:aryl-alcohol dehydrogenase-like predicted oxidoreductase
MRYVDVGGRRLSVIGLGTWQFGSREWAYGSDYAARDALAITARALDLGINLIDTAEIYGFGRSERIVGRAIATRRDEVYLATKMAPVVPVSAVVARRAAGSARRLGVNRIDLYQLHWPNPLYRSLSSVMSGLRALQADGLVRDVGVSNYGSVGWRDAERILGGPVLSNQVAYNLVQRSPEAAVLPWAQDHDRLVIAYSPLAQGFLSGRYTSGQAPRGVRRANPLFLPDNVASARPLLDALADVAGTHGASSAQVALAWLIRRPNVVVIPGASSVAQLEANVAAAELQLTDEEDRHLDQCSAAFVPRTGASAIPDLVRARLRR